MAIRSVSKKRPFASALLSAAVFINLTVPFTPQAPLAQWSDERQEDGCEETSSLMAIAWARGDDDAKTAAQWREEILKLADWEQEKYGENRDVSLRAMLAWIFGDYFKHYNVALKTAENSAEIVAELEKGNVVLAPMNGQALHNPYFTPPGPERHMILIKGYDEEKGEFITNDPGTRRGRDYRYSEETLFGAIRAYETGYHEPFGLTAEKKILVVGRR